MKFSINDLKNRNIERHENFTGFYITKSILLVVHYQTSHLKILSMILIKKQMLIPLRRNHIGLPKTKGTKQSVIVGMVSKLETCGKSIKRFSAQQSARQIQYLIFKYLTLFSLLIFFFSYQKLCKKHLKQQSFIQFVIFFFFGGGGQYTACENQKELLTSEVISPLTGKTVSSQRTTKNNNVLRLKTFKQPEY